MPQRLLSSKIRPFLHAIALMLAMIVVSGCAKNLGESAKATAEAPESQKVEPIKIPFDASRPKYVLHVESTKSATEVTSYDTFGTVDPLGSSNKSILAGNIAGFRPEYTPPAQKLTQKVDDVLKEQLVGAIGNVRNFVLLDEDPKTNNQTTLSDKECGPFNVMLTVTEFSDNAEGGDKTQEGNLSGVLGLLGNRYVNALNPAFGKRTITRVGSVGLNIKVSDVNSNRVIFSVPAHGSFTAKSDSSGLALLGMSSSESAFAHSALGQATQVAFNDAVTKIWDRFQEAFIDDSSLCASKPNALNKSNRRGKTKS